MHTLDYQAMARFCDRCNGRHPTNLHFPRKIAASAIGRGYSLHDAAGVARMPIATVEFWAASDAEFRLLVERARIRGLKRFARRVRAGLAAAMASTQVTASQSDQPDMPGACPLPAIDGVDILPARSAGTLKKNPTQLHRTGSRQSRNAPQTL